MADAEQSELAKRVERISVDLEAALEELRESVDPIGCKIDGLLESAKMTVEATKAYL